MCYYILVWGYVGYIVFQNRAIFLFKYVELKQHGVLYIGVGLCRIYSLNALL